MKNIIILIISILPIYLIGLYIYNKDNEKEPKSLLRKLFLYGIISCIPAGIIEVIIEPFFGHQEDMNLIFLFIYVMIGVALVEELCKWFVVYKVSYNDKAFDHIYDAIVYCVFVSLGFACLENILYVFSSGIVAGILRAITAVPGHAGDAIIMGNYLGMAKLAEINNDDNAIKKNLLLSIIMPTIAHAIYDYCIFTQNIIFIIIFIFFLIYVYIYSIKKIKKISSIKENLINKDNKFLETHSIDMITNNTVNYCPNCGTKASGNFCTNCSKNLTNHKLNNSNNSLTQ